MNALCLKKLGHKQKGSILYNKEKGVPFEVITVTIVSISQQQFKVYSIVLQQNVKLKVTSKCKVCHTECLVFFQPG